MFKSKTGAALFVCGILFAVFRMVGTEENAGELLTATERLEAQRTQMEAEQGRHAQDNWHDGNPMDSDWGDQSLAAE